MKLEKNGIFAVVLISRSPVVVFPKTAGSLPWTVFPSLMLYQAGSAICAAEGWN